MRALALMQIEVTRQISEMYVEEEDLDVNNEGDAA